jgi:hypothetical protein
MDAHDLRPFKIPAAKSMSFKTIDAIDVAARYFVYKLYEATGGQERGTRPRAPSFS